MPKPSAAESGAPPKLSTYTIKLDDTQLETLRGICQAKGWEPFDVPYARFAFRGPEVNVTAYDKRRVVVIAGKGTEDFVLNTLETEITQAPRLGYDEVLHPERFVAHAGLDESGKGDFFGPVVAATVIADKPAIDAWRWNADITATSQSTPPRSTDRRMPLSSSSCRICSRSVR